jgi:LysM repeat protein
MSGIFNFLNDLYIQFMVWLGAEPPSGYEHLVEEKPAVKPVPPPAEPPAEKATPIVEEETVVSPAPPEVVEPPLVEEPIETSPPVVAEEPAETPPPTQLPLDRPVSDETPEAVVEDEIEPEPSVDIVPGETPEITEAEELLFRYEVQRGDTLNAVARRYGLTVKTLLDANDLEDPSRIYPGLKLVIPGYMLSSPELEPPPHPPPTPTPTISDQFLYTVASGDTLNAIAKRYGITLRDLIEANTLEDPIRIFVGQKLVIPGVLAPPSVPLTVDTDPQFPPVGPMDAIRATYVSYFAAGHQETRDSILHLLNTTELNAVVIDAKSDFGRLTYPSQNGLAHEIGAGRDGLEGFGQFMSQVKEREGYPIARIVVFKDNLLARARPDLAVKTKTDTFWVDGDQLGWADPFQIAVWEYNIQLAVEAAGLGFEEIHFDLVRFPTLSQAGAPTFSQPANADSRVAAITGFLSAARGQLKPFEVKVSARVLGYTCWRTDDYVIGQNLERIAENVDVLSPALYPTTFDKGIPGIKLPVTQPYEVVYQSVRRTAERVQGMGCDIRPWIQDFPDYRFDNRSFTKTEIQAQIKACFDAGATGYMVWNPNGNYTPDAYAPVTVKA